jgi:myo-inositol-1(or 4)-monophosphatase
VEAPNEFALLEEIEAHAVNISRQAGQILLEQFHQPQEVKFKSKMNKDPVTTADGLSNDYLKRSIKEKFPGHDVLSEESAEAGGSGSPFLWVIDPLDGTVNFMNGLPLFAVSVGVLWKRQPAAGAIWVPVSHAVGGAVYHARSGGGAFLDAGKIAGGSLSTGRPLVQLGGRARLSGESRKEPHESRNLGSIALEMALTAAGVFRYSLFAGPKLWDVAAGVVLLKEAGGVSLARVPGAKRWQVLDRFRTEQDKDSEPLEKLRGWSYPVLCGPAGAAEKVARDIRFGRSPLSTLTRFWSKG